MKLIELNLQRIIDLCRKHKVKTLAVFGSILTDKFNDQSDVDLLVDFDEEITYHNYADNFFELYHALRNLSAEMLIWLMLHQSRTPISRKNLMRQNR